MKANGGAKREAGREPLSLSTPPKKQKIRSRSMLEREYKTLFGVTLPAVAKAEGWPVRLNHCLMRVALDGYWQCCRYEKLDQKKGALKIGTLLGPPANGTRKAEPRQEAGPFADLGPFRRPESLARCSRRSLVANAQAAQRRSSLRKDVFFNCKQPSYEILIK
jgi:hypothetical protein